jgi:hypothetical protein
MKPLLAEAVFAEVLIGLAQRHTGDFKRFMFIVEQIFGIKAGKA